MKKQVSLLLVFLFVMLALVSCGNTTPSSVTTTGTPTTTVAPHLQIPTVSISEDGLASWNAVENAANYRYIIDGGEPKSTTKTSVQLSDGESISVMAVSGSDAFRDSEYSAPVTYHAPSAGPITATIPEVLSGVENTVYSVKGIVCATAPTSFLLTDNSGSYLYVFAQMEHGLVIGDEAEVVGTKVTYCNISELKSVQSIERLSQNNELNQPILRYTGG